MPKTLCLASSNESILRLLAALTLVIALGTLAQTPRALFAPAPTSPIRVGERPADLVAGDVNGDGNVDLVTANYGGNNITILLGDGRGGFRPISTLPFPGEAPPHLLALGDLNGDKKPDLAVTSHNSNSVVILLGDGRGGFAAAPGSSFPLLRGTEPHNHGLVLADVNRDGNLDITTANQNHNSVSVLLGDGRSGFAAAPGSPFPVGRAPYNHAVGDVNRDGNLDIATPNVRDNTASVLLGDGEGAFAPAPGSPFRVEYRPYFAGLADVNNDRNLDLITTHDDITLITILLGDGRGGFRPAPGSPVDAGCRGGRAQLADINGDDKTDIVMGTNCNTVVVLLGNGRGGFAPAPGSPYAVGRGPWVCALADVTRDGKLDLVTANFDSNDVTVLLAR